VRDRQAKGLSESNRKNLLKNIWYFLFRGGGPVSVSSIVASFVRFLTRNRLAGTVFPPKTPQNGPLDRRSYPVHNAILGADRFQIENMVLAGVPEAGSTIVALPLKVRGAPECCARVIAIVE
jgi:kynurenine formamidase